MDAADPRFSHDGTNPDGSRFDPPIPAPSRYDEIRTATARYGVSIATIFGCGVWIGIVGGLAGGEFARAFGSLALGFAIGRRYAVGRFPGDGPGVSPRGAYALQWNIFKDNVAVISCSDCT